MGKLFTAIILLAVLFCGSAWAVDYSVDLIALNGQGDDDGPVVDATVKMQFYDGDEWTAWILAAENPDGTYTVQRDDWQTEWKVYIGDPDVNPILPDQNPCNKNGTTNSFEFRVVVNE